jgi:hypothetical protein
MKLFMRIAIQPKLNVEDKNNPGGSISDKKLQGVHAKVLQTQGGNLTTPSPQL